MLYEVITLRIGKVIEYMEENYFDKIYIDQLAEIAFMSTRNFQRIFQKAVGESFSDYLLSIRLQKARQYLHTTQNSIATIAIDCGFNDSNYFRNNFV